MAKIENGILVLTDEEKECLRKNLMNVVKNLQRDEFMERIEKLEYEETEDGFVIRGGLDISMSSLDEDAVS